MKIYVTQEHINRGIKNDCIRCPVALALFDAFPNTKRVDVDTGTLFWTNSMGDRNWSKTPRSVWRFINRFDRGSDVKPFAFIWRERL